MMEKARNTTEEEWNEAYYGWIESDEDRTLYESFEAIPTPVDTSETIMKGNYVRVGDTDCLENITDPSDYIPIANSENPADYHNTVPIPPFIDDAKDNVEQLINIINMMKSENEHDEK